MAVVKTLNLGLQFVLFGAMTVKPRWITLVKDPLKYLGDTPSPYVYGLGYTGLKITNTF